MRAADVPKAADLLLERLFDRFGGLQHQSTTLGALLAAVGEDDVSR